MQSKPNYPERNNILLDTVYDKENKYYTTENRKAHKRKGLKQRLTQLFKPPKA